MHERQLPLSRYSAIPTCLVAALAGIVSPSCVRLVFGYFTLFGLCAIFTFAGFGVLPTAQQPLPAPSCKMMLGTGENAGLPCGLL